MDNMGPMPLVVLAILASGYLFEFINGFHDTANAVATIIGTRVLKRGVAICFAALLNFAGAMIGTAVAKTIGKDIIHEDAINSSVILCGLLGAIVWNLFTWYHGLPSSSSHALIGGLVGVAVVESGWSSVQYTGVIKVMLGLVLTPIISLFGACLMMVMMRWICMGILKTKLDRSFRILQLFSAGFMAFSHGSNDAQKTMGIITITLLAAGLQVPGADGSFQVQTWVIVTCALTMALGTGAGGSRITNNVIKIVELDPAKGFVAESFSAILILIATIIGLPVSTTHTLSSAVAGTGWSEGPAAVRWLLVFRMVWAWVFTIPCSALLGSIFALIWKAFS